MSWLYWIFDTSGFAPVASQPGWSQSLVTASLLTFITQATVTFALGVIALVFCAYQPRKSPFSIVIIAFAAMLFLDSLSFTCRAISFYNPFYRLIVMVNIAAAVQSLLVIGFTIPLLIHRDWLKEEGVTLTAVERLDRIQKASGDQLKRLENAQQNLSKRERELNRILAELDRLPRVFEGKPLDDRGVQDHGTESR
jgi:hypothetical protein